MRKEILDRYSRTPDNKLMIDIAAGKIEDLYNDLDQYAPYVKKELDPDLVEYLIDSVNEIGKEDFVIHFRFMTPTPSDSKQAARVKTSIHNYFLYLKELEFRELARMTRTSLILFFIGVVVLSLSVWVNQKIADNDTVIKHVFAEGLNVAAWVSLWNAIATFLINWAPRRQQIKMYDRIATATIFFHGTTTQQTEHDGKIV